jgi:hypothetical protein
MSTTTMSTTNTFTMPTTAAEANRIGVSICIPRVFNNINHRRIKSWFIQNLRSWGFVERVDVVPVFKDGRQVHKRAYVHYAVGKFNIKADDGSGNKIIDALVGGDTIQVVYDDPWYWKLSLSRAARPAEPPKPRQGPAVKIELKRSSVSATGEEKTPEVDIANAPTLTRSELTRSVHDELDDSEEDKETVVSYERSGAAELAMFGEEAFDDAN